MGGALRRVLSLAALGVLATVPLSRALAEVAGEERALLLWERGIDAVRRGDLREAEAALQQSFAATPRGQTACELGRVLRRVSRLDEAAQWLERCAEDPRLPSNERGAALAEARLLRTWSGALVLRGGSAGERAIVDGAVSLDLPLTEDVAPLAAGAHRVEVIDGLGHQRTYSVEVLGGHRLVLDVSSPPATAEVARRRGTPRWALWTTLALSLASAIGAGVAFGYDLSLSRRVTFEDPEGFQDRADRARLTSALLAGVAGVGLAVSLVLIPTLRPPAARRRAEAVLRVALLPLGARF